MKRETNDGNLERPRNKNEAGELLGKRHEYQGTARSGLVRTARRIGFTPEEVSELERIYRATPNGLD